MKSMNIFKGRYEVMKKAYDELYETALKQNHDVVRLQEELRQAKHLISLYEACITKGVKIDFPNSEKGGNSANTGSNEEIDFSDF